MITSELDEFYDEHIVFSNESLSDTEIIEKCDPDCNNTDCLNCDLFI